MCPQEGSAAELGQWVAVGWGISNPIGFTGMGQKQALQGFKPYQIHLKEKPYGKKLLYLEVPKATQGDHEQFQRSPP